MNDLHLIFDNIFAALYCNNVNCNPWILGNCCFIIPNALLIGTSVSLLPFKLFFPYHNHNHIEVNPPLAISSGETVRSTVHFPACDSSLTCEVVYTFDEIWSETLTEESFVSVTSCSCASLPQNKSSYLYNLSSSFTEPSNCNLQGTSNLPCGKSAL